MAAPDEQKMAATANRLKALAAADMNGQLDLAALAEAESDMLNLFNSPATDPSIRARVDAEREAFQEKLASAEMTEEERAEREAKQQAHAAKIRRQRAEAEQAEAESFAAKREQARVHGSSSSGVMGIGRVPVDIGDASPAYEYELHFDSVDVYVKLPAGTRAKQLQVDTTARSLTIGMKGKPPYLKGALGGVIHPDDTVWTIEDGEVKVELAKANPTEHWASCVQVEEGWACAW